MSGDVRFRIGCRMLRGEGRLNFARPNQLQVPGTYVDLPRPGESVVDWMVRAGMAITPQDALEGLLRARGETMVQLRDSWLANPNPSI